MRSCGNDPDAFALLDPPREALGGRMERRGNKTTKAVMMTMQQHKSNTYICKHVRPAMQQLWEPSVPRAAWGSHDRCPATLYSRFPCPASSQLFLFQGVRFHSRGTRQKLGPRKILKQGASRWRSGPQPPRSDPSLTSAPDEHAYAGIMARQPSLTTFLIAFLIYVLNEL